MKVAVFGLGYVGSVTAACLASKGHQVVGVDINREKVARLQAGEPPVLEPGLDHLIAEAAAAGRVSATMKAAVALQDAEVALVCVGTPSKGNGDLDLTYVERVCEQIAEILPALDQRLTIAIRSTVLPGTSERLIQILEGTSGLNNGHDFGFAMNPEFLREGSAMHDFNSPPFTVIGASDNLSHEAVARLYVNIDAPLELVELGVAETIKYASNAFHALKVVFANEIGSFCKAHGIDSHQVMDIFIKDDQLNLSSYYLRPGFAFGGSCLGKDLRALLYEAKSRDLNLPVLEAIMPSNEIHVERAYRIIASLPSKDVAMVGLSFKPGTDDLRESPSVELAEQLLGKGYHLAIYDREVSMGKLHGSNREFIEKRIPHLGRLLTSDLQVALSGVDIVVITRGLKQEEMEVLSRTLGDRHRLVDLVRLDHNFVANFPGEYFGIGW